MSEFARTLTVAVGILLGLLWSRRTGWSCGGIITPSLLALHLGDITECIAAVVLGVLLTPLLAGLKNRFCLYGRERVGVSMLLALAARAALSSYFPVPPTFGWVVPGLIAADSERQGVVMTLTSAVCVTFAAHFTVKLLLCVMDK